MCFACIFLQIYDVTLHNLSPRCQVSMQGKAVLQVGDTITNAKVLEGQDYLVEPKGGPSSA